MTRICNYLLIGFCLAILFSCQDNEGQKRKIAKDKAYKIIKSLNEDKINMLYKWNFFVRGSNGSGLWYTTSDSPRFSCFVGENEGTLIFSVEPNSFIKTFGLNSSVADSISRWNIKTIDNNILYITSIDQNGRVSAPQKSYSTVIFRKENPLIFFQELRQLVDTLGIYNISSGRAGNFIEFQISDRDILTYIPDSIRLDKQYEKVWKAEFTSGKMINKNWNLRTLATPKDGA